MPLIRADPATHTLAVNPDKFTVRAVITTIDPDRAGDIVVPTGLQNADDFLLNPVVLWAHNRSQFPPIGVCEWLDVQPRRIVVETRFAHGVPFSEDVFRLYEQGILRGWSIGFIPRKLGDCRSSIRACRPLCAWTSGTCSNTRRCRFRRTPARSRWR
jgi:hypothetical protein